MVFEKDAVYRPIKDMVVRSIHGDDEFALSPKLHYLVPDSQPHHFIVYDSLSRQPQITFELAPDSHGLILKVGKIRNCE